MGAEGRSVAGVATDGGVTFAEIQGSFLVGLRVRRVGWPKEWKYVQRSDDLAQIGVLDLLASDWELVDEPETPPYVCAVTVKRLEDELRSARTAIARLEYELSAANHKFTSLKGSYGQLHAAATQNKKVLDDVEALAKRFT